MKKYIAYLCLIGLFSSCAEEPQAVPQEPQIEWHNFENITIESIHHLLPMSQLLNKTEAVFSTTEGKQVILQFLISEETTTKKLGEELYEADEYNIQYLNESIHYSMYVQGSGNYSEGNGQATLFVVCGIAQFETSYRPMVTIGSNSDTHFGDYKESEVIAGREFQDVYTNRTREGVEAYAKVYYSPSLGLVGYVDREGDEYSLEEIR